MNSIEYKPKFKGAKNIEDFNIKVKPLLLSNSNCDIWSLGITILEIFLSMFVQKKDCREMVHNLYLNKLSYQSRCSILNELLDSKKNQVICDLLKDMLRDSDQGRPSAS